MALSVKWKSDLEKWSQGSSKELFSDVSSLGNLQTTAYAEDTCRCWFVSLEILETLHKHFRLHTFLSLQLFSKHHR